MWPLLVAHTSDMFDAFACGLASVGQPVGGSSIAGAAVCFSRRQFEPVPLHATNQSKLLLGLLTCQRISCKYDYVFFDQQVFVRLFHEVSRILLLIAFGECILRTSVSTSPEKIVVDGNGGVHWL